MVTIASEIRFYCHRGTICFQAEVRSGVGIAEEGIYETRSLERRRGLGRLSEKESRGLTPLPVARK